MRLMSLHLSNFQGIKDFEVNPNGHDLVIKGRNGAGKSTIGNAISYLLTGKPASGETGYTPKTRDEKGQEVHGLNHVVEATFVLDSGERISLKRDYHEVYTSKRGSADKTYSGNTTDFFVDGVPVAEKDYNARLKEIFSPDMGKMLTTPNYFPEVLSWQDRRKTLLEICGDVTDKDVINANGDLSDLLGYLRKKGTTDSYYTVDEYKAIAAVNNKKIKEEMATIKPRIDEAERAIPDLEGMDKAVIEGSIKVLSEDRVKLQEELASIGADSAMIANRKELAELQTRQVEARAAYSVESGKVNLATEEKINALWKDMQKERNAYQDMSDSLYKAQRDLETMKVRRSDALDRYNKRFAEQYEEKPMPELSTVCPTCGQAIPEDQLEESREKFRKEQEKAKADFNQRKSEDLTRLMEEGKKYGKDVIASKENEISELEDAIKAKDEEIVRIDDQIKELRASMVTVKPFEETEEYKDIKAKVDNLKALIESRSSDVTEAKKGVQAKIDAKSSEIHALEGKLSGFAVADKQKKRIEELEAREKELAGEQEYIERGIYLCDQFTVAKVNMLDEKINSRFQNVRFKMFDVQVNGGIKDVCEPLVRSTGGWMPYSSASNAERINGGLEIINVLSEHYRLQMPVVIDNAEAVCEMVHTDAQQIRLVVSDLYDKLNITVDGEASSISA